MVLSGLCARVPKLRNKRQDRSRTAFGAPWILIHGNVNRHGNWPTFDRLQGECESVYLISLPASRFPYSVEVPLTKFHGKKRLEWLAYPSVEIELRIREKSFPIPAHIAEEQSEKLGGVGRK